VDEHWQRWHDDYDVPDSSLARRLAAVQARVRDAVDGCPPGPVRILSACAGQARDVVGALAGHPRACDVRGRLVELDPVNAARARSALAAAGLAACEVVEADAGDSAAYAGAVPADVVLLCGIFGNVPDADVATTVAFAPRLCAPGATVIWTRHRRPPDLTPRIRAWFADAGFAEVAFDAPPGTSQSVGTHRLTGEPPPYLSGVTLFAFVPGQRGR
jgi:hypothetical protein